MAGISFKNAPFRLGGRIFFATAASVEETHSYQRVEGLGYTNVGAAESSRPNGSFSADFYLRDGDANHIFQYFGSLRKVNGSLGPVSFTEGYITEFSFSIEPVSLVKASVRGVFFQKMTRGGSWASAGTLSGLPDDTFAHGAKTTVSISEAISVSYSITQSVTPHYVVGSDTIAGVKYDGGEVKVTIQGKGLQKAISECPDEAESVNINLGTLCGGGFDNVSTLGLLIISSSVSVNANEEVVGSMELMKYI